MKIFIATPAGPRDIQGGPALYARNLIKEFEKQGHAVRVVAFSNIRFLPGFRHVWFLLRSFPSVLWADCVFSLDHFSVGFPAAISCLIFRKKFYIRVGGDFLWERFVEKNRKEISLSDFYKIHPQLSIADRFIRLCIVFTFKRADKIVFSSSWQRNLFLESYRILASKTAVIENYFIKRESVKDKTNEFIWVGRMIFLKNLERLIDAFSEFIAQSPERNFTLHLIGDGPEKENLKSKVKNLKLETKIKIESALNHNALLERLKKARIFLLPSFSEVTPNLLLEAISFSVPFIATKYTSYYEKFRELGLFVDPFDKIALINAFEHMLFPKAYEVYEESLLKFSFSKDWGEIAKEYLALFKS